ncbi:hypothetical protein [Pseudonocardia yuanmonensis]|uniref:hypothetical protein n=1 Tax=Pseudonocardia yuanmonensis TaxID=1095914 RepID=UPI0031EEA97E
MTLEGADAPVAVVLDGREGNQVFVRQADPADGEPPRIPIYDGEQVVMMTAIAAVSVNQTEEVGRVDDLLTWARAVPVRREGNTVFARTLTHGEPDEGHRVHVRPGDQLSFEQGTIVIELDAIDEKEAAGVAEGEYVPITPVLWTWMSVGGGHDQGKVRYLLAAARRLDAANVLLADVEKRRQELAREDLTGPVIRRGLFGLIAAVELAVVAVGRVCDMIDKAGSLLGSMVPVPQTVAAKRAAVNDIRNAYEHIEDRALGTVFGRPHPDALTIFNHVDLLERDRISYGASSLDLKAEMPNLISEARQFLKDVAADA